MAQEFRASVRLSFDGKEFVGGIRLSREELDRFSASAKGSGASVEGAGRGVQTMTTHLRALISVAAAYKAISFGTELVHVGIAAERTATQLRFATGSAEQGRTEYAFLRQTVEELGLDLESAAGAFGKLSAASRGTSLEGQGTREIFRAVAEASSVMGLSAGESEGVLLAISQMMSKGTVQAEELRGQLGERLPGAFQVAARAMGVTTAELGKMLESGTVLADDFLPRFATELRKTMADELPNATRTAQSEINRLSNAWTELKQGFAASGVLSTAADLAKGLADSVRDITAAVREAQQDGAFKAFWVGLGGVAAMFSGADDKSKLKELDDRIARRIEFMKDLPEAGRASYNQSMSRDLVEADQLRARIAGDAGGRSREPPPPRAPPLDLDAATAAGASRFSQLTSGLKSKDEEFRARTIELWTAFVDAGGRVTNDDVQGALGQLRERVYGKSKAPEFLGRTAGRIADVAFQQLPEEEREVAKFLTQGRELGVQESTLGQYAHALRAVHEAERNRLLTQQQSADAIKAEVQAVEEKLRLDELEARMIAQHEGQGTDLRESLAERTRGIGIDVMKDARAQAWAAFDEEKRAWQQRISALALNAELRKSIEDEYANWVAARHQQLTEQLKPEWQKMVEGWSDTTRLMREALDNFVMRGLEAGEEAFVAFARTGKASIGSLVDTIVAETARVAYRQHLAQPFAQGLQSIGGSLLGMVGGGGSSNPSSVNYENSFDRMNSGGGDGLGGLLSSVGSWIVGMFHEGGIAGSPTRSRAVDPLLYRWAPRMHGGGIAGDEVPTVLKMGEGVFTPKQMAALAPVPREGLAQAETGGAGTVINYSQTVNVMPGASRETANQAAMRVGGQTQEVLHRFIR